MGHEPIQFRLASQGPASIAGTQPEISPELSIAEDFRLAMRSLAAGVSVITSASYGEWHGLAATSVSSLSMEPPSLLVCVNRSASLRPALQLGAPFAVNLLSHYQSDVSQAFGGALKGADRFKIGRWQLGHIEVPILADAIAVVECVVDAEMDYGSHTIIVGKAVRALRSEYAEPLIYLNGSYQ